MSKPNPTDMRDTEIYAKVIDKDRHVTIDNGASPIERSDLTGPSTQDPQVQVPAIVPIPGPSPRSINT